MRAFRIVIAGHGELPTALLSTAEMIVGRIDDAYAVSLGAEESPEGYIERLRVAFDGRPALVLCDLAGCTPANCALRIKATTVMTTTVMTGVNLGIAVEAVLWTGPLDEALAERLLSAGRDGISVAATGRS